MSKNTPAVDPRRTLPSVDTVLQRIAASVDRWGHGQVSQAVRNALARVRRQLDEDVSMPISYDAIQRTVENILAENNRTTLRPVFNLTGTVLHTNLGRTLLPPESVAAMVAVATSPSTLEFDLDTGERGERDSHVETLICELAGTEAATVVNNNAAAVFLVLNTLAQGGEVPTSRGELVGIGAAFPVPEIVTRSGYRLVEIGTTNRTHLGDYENAIGENTALLMKVHTSNYRIDGFTHTVNDKALAETPKLYRNPTTLCEKLPTLRLLTRTLADVEAQADRLLPRVGTAVGPGFQVAVSACRSQFGSGALPVDTLPSTAIGIVPAEGGGTFLQQLSTLRERLQ